MNYFAEALTYILSMMTIISLLLAGNMKKEAWLIGLANQALWLVWIFMTKNWGFIPMNAALWVVHFRNYHLWRQADEQAGKSAG